MTKWFDSNYHYLVPELDESTPIDYVPGFGAVDPTDGPAAQVLEALAAGEEAPRPVVVGPVTYLLLAKASDAAGDGFRPLDRLADVLDAYGHMLADLWAAGAQWVQLDEPALVCDAWDVPREEVLAAAADAYTWIAAIAERPRVLVAGTYGPLGDALPVLAGTGVEAIGLDLVAGELPPAADLARLGGKTVVAGVVSGRNIWRTDLGAALAVLESLRGALPDGTPVVVATSTSLQHVPHDADRETSLPDDVRSWLAFADQKVAEVRTLAVGLARGRQAIAGELTADARLRAARAAHPGVRREEVRSAVAAVTDADRTRAPYAERAAAQAARLRLPLLPTTTIGSFPQTAEVRAARAAHRRGRLDDAGLQWFAVGPLHLPQSERPGQAVLARLPGLRAGGRRDLASVLDDDAGQPLDDLGGHHGGVVVGDARHVEGVRLLVDGNAEHPGLPSPGRAGKRQRQPQAECQQHKNA